MLRNGNRVIGAFIDAVDWSGAINSISKWGRRHESRYVCICNAHSVVTARVNSDFREVVNGADMATPDGAPVAWMLRRLGFFAQERINGPDLMWKYFSVAEKNGEGVFLYGGTQGTLDALKIRINAIYPNLRVVGAISPPFRPLDADEEESVVNTINESGAETVWVSLGCPKQEKWMAAHRGKINAVMIGVGAAFDYHAGTITRAPVWMRNFGFEWLHRLASEPKRLWRRYFVTNSLFIYYAILQLVFSR
jgi:N-acetylglucosaminyldiphosphoundecaprenol N-acetyl-beta-D-mannosaminyltransferase